MGELIINEKYLTITFRFKEKKNKINDKIAWNPNEKSIDGFNQEVGWIRIDLTKLFHIHRVYEIKRKRIQSVVSKKPKIKKSINEVF